MSVDPQVPLKLKKSNLPSTEGNTLMGTVTSSIFCFAEDPYPEAAILRDKESS
jgi:hypothetical protein